MSVSLRPGFTFFTTNVFQLLLVAIFVSRRRAPKEFLVPSDTTTQCPYKGTATYWSLRVEGQLLKRADSSGQEGRSRRGSRGWRESATLTPFTTCP